MYAINGLLMDFKGETNKMFSLLSKSIKGFSGGHCVAETRRLCVRSSVRGGRNLAGAGRGGGVSRYQFFRLDMQVDGRKVFGYW